MVKMPVSIFNDVIGPVMRGPSSSHTAAAVRIGRMIAMAAGSKIRHVAVDYDVNGSLAETHDGQGSDMGLISGLLGIEMHDPRMLDAAAIAVDSGMDVSFNILDYGAVHPNNYRIKITTDKGITQNWEAISTGGGMIRMWKYDCFDIDIVGDYYELLIISSDPHALASVEALLPDCEHITTSLHEDRTCINVKTTSRVSEEAVSKIASLGHVDDVLIIDAVLPVLSKANCNVPFSNAAQLLEYTEKNGREMWELAAVYESIRGNISEHDVYTRMFDLTLVIDECAKEGLAGTTYKDRILGPQAHLIMSSMEEKRIPSCDLLSNVIKNITAIMEVKSSYGVIIAAPTAGSCGCLPGTLLGVAESMNFSKDELTKGMLAAALIGVFIAENATFAAEVAGCQVECGAGSAMAAAGVVQLMGGTVRQCLDAASMAFQNVSGLVCDPVANRTEVPCLGKNVMGGANAVSCAIMALSGYDSVIPLDETIGAIYNIGQLLPGELRCTFGGLGKTRTALAIKESL